MLKKGAIIGVRGNTEKAQRIGTRIVSFGTICFHFHFNIQLILIKNEQTPSILGEKRVLQLKDILALGIC